VGIQIVKYLRPAGIVEDDDEHAVIADRQDAPRYLDAVVGLCTGWQSGVFILDLVGCVGFGKLSQVKRIAKALSKFFEPRHAAGQFVFGGGRSGFGHSSILSNSRQGGSSVSIHRRQEHFSRCPQLKACRLNSDRFCRAKPLRALSG
jgi:hypothetical protein